MNADVADSLRSFNADLPLEQARTIPRLWYIHPEIYELERQNVFGQTWLAVGRTDQLQKPGAFITHEIAGEPILVVRDADGSLRAFHNVCQHRAARVMTAAEGQATRLRCPYHGWTYDLSGRLHGVPEFEGVADFCREDNGLVHLAVAEWGPLVFVHPMPMTFPLHQYLAPLPQHVSALHLESLRFVERRQYDLACNWKVYVDNYLDGGYHVNSVHPGLAGVLDYKQYRTEVNGHTSVQISPLKSGAAEQAVGKVRTGANADYWWIFPNLMLNIYEGVMDTNLVLPLGPDRCRVIFDFYFSQTDGDEAKRFIADSIAVGHQIQMEDMGVCEDVQRGLGSRSYDTGRFSVRREIAGYHFHRLLARYLRA